MDCRAPARTHGHGDFPPVVCHSSFEHGDFAHGGAYGNGGCDGVARPGGGDEEGGGTATAAGNPAAEFGGGGGADVALDSGE